MHSSFTQLSLGCCHQCACAALRWPCYCVIFVATFFFRTCGFLSSIS
uniref:Uncharacterized protein n=1 Tax=Anguilla anguilla TaxID=7936 RepID=A0A0E9S4K7_ANGAN